MDDKVAKLRGVSLWAGAALYFVAAILFGITLVLMAEMGDRFSGRAYVLAIVGEAVVGIGLAVFLWCMGIQLRYVARQIPAP